MISYIKGEITFKSPTHIIVETGGIGYHVNVSLNTYSAIESLQQVKILTVLHIKEDAHTLYGFADELERGLFNLLITVSGVGTNTARLLLSAMNPDELKSAIIHENVVALSKVKGIGPKTAQRILLDLKDKVMKEVGDKFSTIQGASSALSTSRDEALAALVTLGFNKIEVQKALNKILKEQPNANTVEDLIKIALKQLA